MYNIKQYILYNIYFLYHINDNQNYINFHNNFINIKLLN